MDLDTVTKVLGENSARVVRLCTPKTLRQLGSDGADSTPYRDLGDCLPVRTASHPRKLEFSVMLL